MESIREIFRIGYGPSSSHTMGGVFLFDCKTLKQLPAGLQKKQRLADASL